jgi:hypothetical protein
MTETCPIAEQQAQRQRPRSGWLAITGLLLLSALPVIGGALRLGEVSADPEAALPVSSSVAIVAHIVAMSMFCLLGAFQFSPALRIRRGWHRAAGRALIPAGFVAGLSAVWLAVFFGGPPDELALAMVRLVFAVGMTTFLVQGVIAIKRRDFTAHGAGMTRAFAIAVTGGTQALVSVLWALPFGEADVGSCRSPELPQVRCPCQGSIDCRFWSRSGARTWLELTRTTSNGI